MSNVNPENTNFDSCYCSITFDIMKDPVNCPYGFTYEREAIERWIDENNTHPHRASQNLSKSDLIPNRNLKELIDNLMEKGLLKDKIEPIDLSQYKTPKINIIKSQNSRGVKQISIKSSMQKRNNIRIILGLDMSSSMNLTSSPPTSEKDKSSDESVNYSRYDLLKHSVNTFLESMNDSDKITIVTYSSDADILFDNEYLTDDKKREIKEKLNEISPSGGTNIWKGLQKCMECAGKPDDDGLMTSIYMLTGEPTVSLEVKNNV